MAFDDTANPSAHSAIDHGRIAADRAAEAVDQAGQGLKDGYDAAQQYLQDRVGDFDLREFVRREPWIAIAAAFAVGYVVAQLVKRVS
jgi:ElaB/YqjD/DUF883 family membrane-anchored ribosome-binding protein